MSKYEITDISQKFGHNGIELYQIRALVDIPLQQVLAGDVGGWVENEKNLSQSGSCWLFPDAFALRYARIRGDASIRGESVIDFRSKVSGNVMVSSSIIQGVNHIEDNVVVANSHITGQCHLTGYTKVENAQLECVKTLGDAWIKGSTIKGVQTILPLPVGARIQESDIQTADKEFNMASYVSLNSVKAIDVKEFRILDMDMNVKGAHFGKGRIVHLNKSSLSAMQQVVNFENA